MNRRVKYAFTDNAQESKGIEVTHSQTEEGWDETTRFPFETEDIAYLGRCKYDGDMFAVKTSVGTIEIYKGRLNDGN